MEESLSISTTIDDPRVANNSEEATSRDEGENNFIFAYNIVKEKLGQGVEDGGLPIREGYRYRIRGKT